MITPSQLQTTANLLAGLMFRDWHKGVYFVGPQPPTVVVKDVLRGRMKLKQRRMVLPEWLCEHPALYRKWYIAHELAHLIVHDETGGKDQTHGHAFQSVLHQLAPDAHHFEAGYKPRQYAAFLRSFNHLSASATFLVSKHLRRSSQT
jgi:hypothetical protein